MKQLYKLFLCLAFLSLACLGSGAGSSLPAVDESTPSQVSTMGAAAIDEAPLAMSPTLATVPRCAVVIAAESLHLRGSASEHGAVLTWLNRGVVVELVDDSSPNWWRVKLGDLEGFARSIYLQESECVK